jgi:hypothetical protein
MSDVSVTGTVRILTKAERVWFEEGKREGRRQTYELRVALQETVDLLQELRLCPLIELEARQAEIDDAVATAERLLAAAGGLRE